MWPNRQNFTLEIFEVLPAVIIFDCDFTLWPFLFDYHPQAPFRTLENGTVLDSRNIRVSYYKGVPEMLKLLSERNISIGPVNYTIKPCELKQLLNALGWMKYISYLMLHASGPPGQLVKEYYDRKRTFKYRDVLYFDELPYNLFRTERIGVISALAEWGINPDSLGDGLKEYVKRYKHPQTKSPEEIFYQATGRIKKLAATSDATWSLSVTPFYNFISTTPKPT